MKNTTHYCRSTVKIFMSAPLLWISAELRRSRPTRQPSPVIIMALDTHLSKHLSTNKWGGKTGEKHQLVAIVLSAYTTNNSCIRTDRQTDKDSHSRCTNNKCSLYIHHTKNTCFCYLYHLHLLLFVRLSIKKKSAVISAWPLAYYI